MKKSIAEIHDELYMHLRTNYPDVRFGVNGLKMVRGVLV